MTPERLLEILRDTIVGTVRRDGGLAARLEVSKPAITRSLDRLAELGLAKRAPDPRDRRSVLVTRTRRGNDYLNDLRGYIATALKGKPDRAETAAAA
jgi:DNA-binding MarR family transcriptional regulator